MRCVRIGIAFEEPHLRPVRPVSHSGLCKLHHTRRRCNTSTRFGKHGVGKERVSPNGDSGCKLGVRFGGVC